MSAVEMPERSLKEVLLNASRQRASFETCLRGVTYESKGVLFSEMLFLVAAVGRPQPDRVIESGRARGLSTRILSRCFPRAEIISVDLEDCAEDVEHVNADKASWLNVTLIRGDARKVLPDIVDPGDVLLIDGPKSFRALLLAFELLSTRRPAMVFIHDLYRGQIERELLQQWVPEALFSDDPAFVERHGDMDEACWQRIREENLGRWRPYEYAGVPQESYGPTLACLPVNEGRDYASLMQLVIREGFLERARYLRRSRNASEG